MSSLVFKKKKFKLKPKKLIDVVFTYIGLIIVSAIFILPVLWIVISSFNPTGIHTPEGFLPTTWTINNFRILFTETSHFNYPRWLLNTLIVSSLSCVIGTLLVILTAYTMSRFKFRSRKKLMAMTLLLGIFPSFLAMSAIFFIMMEFGLGSIWGLILIYSAGAPLGYLVQKGFFDTIPNSIDEAARIDGATSLGVFIKIILPLSAPILVFTAITSFAWPWSDFILPRVILQESRDMWTVAVGLNAMSSDHPDRFIAGSVLIAVPIIILYFALSKFLISGLSSGATKG
ncbi:MAG: ABC transporter permease subunit [Firmicutes bacterium]|nr:ABC transporter permease subunit [Bacillota bacterium]